MDNGTEKNQNPLLRLAAFLATVVLVLGAVFLLANWQKLNFDSIRRWANYRSLERNSSGQVDSFSYNGGSGSAFTPLGDDLLVCSGNAVWLYAPTGGTYLEESCDLANPVVSAAGNTGLVYDAGGTELYVYRDRQRVFTYSAEAGRTLISAGLSQQGLLTIVTQANGLKGSATVYDASFQPRWAVNLSSRFITDALLSPDGSTLALATAGQTSGIYDSQILFYSAQRSDSGEQSPAAMCSLGNDTVLALNWQGDTLRVLGEEALSLVSPQGELVGTYSYNGQYLKGFALSGNSFSSLLLGRYRAGTDAKLVTVNDKGEELAVLSMNEQVISLSSLGRYLSLLTPRGLTIYTQDLSVYHETDATQGIRKILQREDGTVFLLSTETARLYLPD